MLIDWFTVVAQIVNFLVLVWLLKRFLYRPILNAIDTRESRIATQLTEAAQKETQAQAQAALYQEKIGDLDQKREAMLAQAKLEAEQQHARMLEEARNNVRALEEKWHEDLERSRQTFLLELRRRTAREILAITRRVIADLTCMELEQCAIQAFLHKVRSLDPNAWSQLVDRDMLVRSALNLSEDQRNQILRTIEEQLGRSVHLRFEDFPDIGLGLELRGNGWRIGWNSDLYLQNLDEVLGEAFNRNGGGCVAATKT
jgi:F-type H+-transporting ATPase subunit b